MRKFKNVKTGVIYSEEEIIGLEPGLIWIDGSLEGVEDYNIRAEEMELVEKCPLYFCM